MNSLQRVTKNATVLIVSNIISKAFKFFAMIFLARHLGVEGFGNISFAITYAIIFIVFVDFGLHPLTVREVSRDKSLADTYLNNTLGLKILLATFVYIIISLSINLTNYPHILKLIVYTIAISLILDSMTKTFFSIFHAFEKMEFQAFAQIINSFILFLGTIIGTRGNHNILFFAYLYIFASFITLLYSLTICSKKFIKPSIAINFNIWKTLIKQAWPMCVMAATVMLYFRIDTIMLSFLKDQIAVGLYSAAYRISEAAILLPAMFVSSIYPLLSKSNTFTQNSLSFIYEQSFRLMLYIAIPVAFSIMFLSHEITSFLYGTNFLEATKALQILIWASAIMYLTMLMGMTFLSANKQILNLKMVICAAVINITLNFFFIPLFSFIGASITTAITEAFGLFAGIYFLNKYGYKINLKTIIIFTILATMYFSICFKTLTYINVNKYLICFISLFVYAIMTFKYTINQEDKKLFKKLFVFNSN